MEAQLTCPADSRRYPVSQALKDAVAAKRRAISRYQTVFSDACDRGYAAGYSAFADSPRNLSDFVFHDAAVLKAQAARDAACAAYEAMSRSR